MLLAASLMRWYSPDPVAMALSPQGYTAWQAFSVTDLVIGAAALVAIVPSALVAAGRMAAMPRQWAAGVLAIAVPAAVLIAYRLASPPFPHVTRSAGAFVGLVAAMAICAAAWRALPGNR